MGKEGTPEYIHGKLASSRPTYGLMGFQYGDSQEEEIDGKKPTTGPPITILSSDAGVTQIDDEMWKLTYGSSYDSILTIINGKFVSDDLQKITIGGIYSLGTVNSINDNLWFSIEGAVDDEGGIPLVSQIQFIATGDTSQEGSAAAKANNAELSKLRGIGLRLPMMAGGYGRTIDGLPTDPEPSIDAGGRANDSYHKLARETWKYGPIEMRWDHRRGVWSAYNELITDHYSQGLGTWIFGTNPDGAGGFPFLRAKLEDAFWVRQPVDRAGTDGRLQGVQTGELFTHLKHKWFDEEENGAASLDSIFIIPHKNKTKSPCHEKGAEHTLGPETTGEGLSIDIKTEAHFFKAPGMDGPFAFGGKTSDLNVCCRPVASNYHTGIMLFQDDIATSCGPGGETIIIDSDSQCSWVPAITIDECGLIGGHLTDLVYNDVELGALNASLCAILSTYTEELALALNGNFNSLSLNLLDIQDEVDKAIKATSTCFNVELMGVWTRFDIFRNEVDTEMQRIVDQVNNALDVCCASEFDSIGNVSLPSKGTHDYPDPCKVIYDKSSFLFDGFPEIPCDSCPPIEIWTPCSSVDSIKIIGGCDPVVPSVPLNSDECQAHNMKTNSETGDSGEKGKLSDSGPGPRI